MNDKNIRGIKNTLQQNAAQNKADKEQIKNLEEKLKLNGKLEDSEKELLELAKERNAEYERLIKLLKNHNKELSRSAITLGEIDEYQGSITAAFGKGTKLAGVMTKQLQQAKLFQQAISSEISNQNSGIDESGKKQLANISEAYGTMQESILNANKLKSKGLISDKEANKMIEEAAEKYADAAANVDNIRGLSEETKNLIRQGRMNAEDLAKSLQSAAAKEEQMHRIMEEFSAELGGLGPILTSINTLTKTNIRDTLAWKAAVFALGAALGKAAYDYFGAPIKAGLQADKERHQAEIDNIAAVGKLRKDAEFIPAQIQQERNEAGIEAQNNINRLAHEAQYAAAKASASFSASLQQAAAQFNAASKTALFGKKLGGVGYGAAQLQLAGISADKIAGAMSSAAAATGKMPTGKAAADMAIMAERTGTSVDDIAQISEHFQRIDGMSANMSMNMAEGMRSMADQAGISLGNLMKEVAESSKDALGYQIKSGPALAKQVAYAQSLGVSFGDVAKAGKNMVMNYKDSIKAEMQLSSLLGEAVDLSEVRAKFAQGDTEGAMKSLQAQGLDPAQMDMFQQEALSQALGGMDLQSLSKIATGTGAQVGGLKAGDAGKGNKQFLGDTQRAQAGLEAAQASISANQAVVDAKLSQKIADAYLASPEYNDYKNAQNAAAIEAENLSHKMKDAWLQTDDYKKSLADTMKLNFVDNIKEGLFAGLATVGGGLLTTAVDRLIPKGGIGASLGGIFGFGKSKAAPTSGTASGVGVSETAPPSPAAAAGVGGPTSAASGELPLPLPVTIVGGSGDVTVGDENSTKGFFERLKEGIQKKWDAVTGFFSGIKDRIISVWDRVTGFFSNIWTTVGEKIQGAWQTVTGFFTGIGDKIKGLWDTATSFITDGIRSGWEKVVGFFSGIVDTIKTFFKTKVAGMFKKGGLKSMAPGGGGEEGGGEVSPVVGNSVGKLAKDAGKIGKGLGNLGTGAGKAIAGVLQGLAMGLSFFKNPTVLLGAAGLAGSITLIGAGIAGAAWIMGKALPTLAEGLMAFNKVDGGNLARVGLGIGALGVGMAAMGAGTVIAGIGNLVGSLFGGGIEDTIKKVEKFSQANIDEAKVKNNANAVVSYSKAMAALGAGTALGGIGTLVGSVASAISGFFDKKPPIQKMIEFSKLNINAAKVKENAEAVTLYSKAMASLGGGSALSGLGAAAGAIGSAIGKFFGEKPPIEKMQDFAKLELGDTSKLKTNAEAFTMFGEAMSSYKGGSGSFGGVIADAAAKFFGIEPPVEKMKKFATADLGDTSKLKANADAFTMFGEAMSSYKGENGGLMNVLAEGVAGFFKGETPLEKFQKFAAVSGINVEQVKNNAEAFTAFGNAMKSYEGSGEGFWSSLGKGIASFFGGGEEDLITKFQRFSALNSAGITATANAIASLNASLGNYNATTAANVGTGLTTFATGVTNSGIGGAGSSISSLTYYLDEFNQTMSETSTIATGIYTIADSFMMLARALTDLSGVDVAALNGLPWARMTAFAGVGGGFVIAGSSKNQMNISENSAKNIDAIAKDGKDNLKEIKDMALNTKAMVNLTKNLQALQQALFENSKSATILSIDGKKVATATNRYAEYHKAVQ